MSTAILIYGWIHTTFFGLLVGLAAEQDHTWRHYLFLLLLSFFWPVIVAWKLLCKRGPAAGKECK